MENSKPENSIEYNHKVNFMTLDDAANAINKLGCAHIKERIAQDGVMESGAYAFYKARTDGNAFVSETEVRVLGTLGLLPAATEYHEVGMGAGSLVLTLALTGRKSVGVELDSKRFRLAREIKEQAAIDSPFINDTCELLNAPFPKAVSERSLSDCAAIITNLVATAPQSVQENITQYLSNYRFALVDVSRYFDIRDKENEQFELIEWIKQQELIHCGEILNLGQNGRYHMFKSI